MKALITLGILFLLISKSAISQHLNDTVVDIDGNVYHTVKIGTQVWMIENLNVTHYRNGKVIPHVSDSLQWRTLETGAYCNFQNQIDNTSIFGRLYNWYAAVDINNIAPEGWHVATSSEWVTLMNFLLNNHFGFPDSTQIAPSLSGNVAWNNWIQAGNPGNDLAKNNSTGFNALPCGSRDANSGKYEYLNRAGFWWTSDQAVDRLFTFGCNSLFCGIAWRLWYNDSRLVGFESSKQSGYSIRCVKD